MLDLNKFIEWVEEKSTRSVSIEIGEGVYNPANNDWGIKIWAYDAAIREGQHVISVDDIDLEAQKERFEREQYEKLKRKFEGK